MATATLTGQLNQTSTGTFAVDLKHVEGQSDLLDVSRTAVLSGKVAANLVTFDTANVEKTFTILTAEQGVTINGLTAVDTVLIDYTLLYPDEKTVQITLRRLALNTDGLTPNQINVATYLLNNQSSLPPELAPAFQALFGASSPEELAAITEQLYGQNAGVAATGALQAGQALAVALRSCPVAEGPYGQLRETSCVWAKPEFRRFTQDAGVDMADVESDARGFSGGFQTAIADDVWGGLGLSFEDANSRINTNTSSESELWQIGGVLKWVQGPMKVSGSLSVGQSNIETDRGIAIANAVASSDTDLTAVNGLLRFAYSFGVTGFYVTPMVDVGFAHLSVDGFTETGAGALNLAVASLSETIFSGGPAVEVGATYTIAGAVVSPYFKAGVTFLSEDGFTTSSQFAGAPAALSPFFTTSKFDDVFADLSAGVQMFSDDGVNLRLNYDGHIGENSDQHGVDAKLTVNY